LLSIDFNFVVARFDFGMVSSVTIERRQRNTVAVIHFGQAFEPLMSSGSVRQLVQEVLWPQADHFVQDGAAVQIPSAISHSAGTAWTARLPQSPPWVGNWNMPVMLRLFSFLVFLQPPFVPISLKEMLKDFLMIASSRLKDLTPASDLGIFQSDSIISSIVS
jgi:hypothetical protein